jgi:hypothetical protein
MKIVCDKDICLFEPGQFNLKAYTKYYASTVFIGIHFTNKWNHESFYKMLSEIKFLKVDLKVQYWLLEIGKDEGVGQEVEKRLDLIRAHYIHVLQSHTEHPTYRITISMLFTNFKL